MTANRGRKTGYILLRPSRPSSEQSALEGHLHPRQTEGGGEMREKLSVSQYLNTN